MQSNEDFALTNFTNFDPTHINWQYQSIKDIWTKFDYSKGVHQVLASGSIGSAKSIWMAHNIIKHVSRFSKSRAMIGRLSRPDLKATIGSEIADHIEGDFVEGVDYEFNATDLKWTFVNGSEVISRTWHDGKMTKFRSLRLSMVGIEELTENMGKHWEFYDAVYQRLGRLVHVPMNLLMAVTNPDSPAHPAYKKLVIGAEKDPLKHVYYSLTTDNPFLPEWYVKNQIENLSPIEIERMVYGKWVEDPKGAVYYNYSRARNYRNDNYIYDLNYPIALMHDFNIGEGKPMSAAAGQLINGIYHIAKTYIVDGANTEEIMKEIIADGLFEKQTHFEIYGDAAGQSRDTRSKTTDYEIIERCIKTYRTSKNRAVAFSKKVPRANPPIRKRHNRVNAKCCNFEGKVQLYIYKDAEEADDGMRLTKLKKGGNYLEDDSLRQQHVTTALGYWIVYTSDKSNMTARVGSHSR